MSEQSAEIDAVLDGPSFGDYWPADDDEGTCEHPAAAVISDVSGDHFCARCNTDWWEDPL